MLDLNWKTGSRNMGGGVVFKVRSTQSGFGANWRINTKG
jgi:hypothetical protein